MHFFIQTDTNQQLCAKLITTELLASKFQGKFKRVAYGVTRKTREKIQYPFVLNLIQGQLSQA
jgi:hypothetical protein